ncbi:MAG: potassium channel family protein [Xenococcaceae cyanobacterium]
MFNYTPEQKYLRLQKELIGGGVTLASVFAIGTLWYWLIEQWPWFDAAYMTIITLATVGYGETHPLGERGRLFTIGLILMGLITIGYIVNRFTEAIIQGYFQDGIRIRQERKSIDSLNEHYILCGFGRTGRQIAQEFATEGIPFIIIDSNSDQIDTIKQLGYMVIQGDATLDDCLLQAKIDKAVCLVAALTSDAENLYTVLSAKSLNPQIRAIARASTEEAVKKIQRAGADAVVSPYITGGRRLAAAALRPQVMDFVEGIFTGSERSYYLEEFLVDEKSCPFVNKTLSEARLRSQSGALVLGMRRINGTFIAGPTGDTRLMAGDLLICMGTAEQLLELNRILAPTKGGAPRIPRQNQG